MESTGGLRTLRMVTVVWPDPTHRSMAPLLRGPGAPGGVCVCGCVCGTPGELWSVEQTSPDWVSMSCFLLHTLHTHIT